MNRNRKTSQTAGIARGRLVAVACAFVASYMTGCSGYKSAEVLASNTRLDRVVFSAVDCETTGLDSKSGRIVEIGVVKFRGSRQIGSRSWLVNPGIPIPPSAVSVHGITTDMVSHSPEFASVFPQFKEYVGDTVVLAHNARFDLAFLNGEIKRAGLDGGKNTVVDTLPVFRRWFPRASRHTLEALVQYLELESDGFHRGLTDAESLFEVFKTGVETQGSKMSLEDLVRAAGGELRFVAKDRSDKP
ncbi:MAG: 3'-5' exonuclease [bacterium]